MNARSQDVFDQYEARLNEMAEEIRKRDERIAELQAKLDDAWDELNTARIMIGKLEGSNS